MGLRETLQAHYDELDAQHEENRTKYRQALANRKEADDLVRATCETASQSANDRGAALKALQELDRNTPEVSGEGSIQSDDAGAEG